jgi:hypothetical protein
MIACSGSAWTAAVTRPRHAGKQSSWARASGLDASIKQALPLPHAAQPDLRHQQAVLLAAKRPCLNVRYLRDKIVSPFGGRTP